MSNKLTSVIIPDRNEQFLKKTVDDLLAKAEEEIEIILVFDGTWSKYVEDFTDKRIKMIHHGTERESKGMRASINAGVAVSQGEYIMVLDGHCMMGQGYDKILKADCEENWLVIPRRHRLDPEKWEIANNGKSPIDYMMIDYPMRKQLPEKYGLHGLEDRQRYYDRKKIMIDDVMSCQGSCYFCTKKHWNKIIIRLEDENYGHFAQEAQEVCFKTWFSGGRVIVNKNTYYVHLHKGSKYGKNYAFSNAQYRKHTASIEKGRLYCNDFWLNNKWDKRVHDFEWLVERFMPIHGWAKDWKKQFKKVGLMK